SLSSFDLFVLVAQLPTGQCKIMKKSSFYCVWKMCPYYKYLAQELVGYWSQILCSALKVAGSNPSYFCCTHE
uniref:Uncharacterized protein n=1 Tax=Scleropages formosus TaxID=113540 RepID=A0A8C9RYS1_SCLFO